MFPGLPALLFAIATSPLDTPLVQSEWQEAWRWAVPVASRDVRSVQVASTGEVTILVRSNGRIIERTVSGVVRDISLVPPIRALAVQRSASGITVFDSTLRALLTLDSRGHIAAPRPPAALEGDIRSATMLASCSFVIALSGDSGFVWQVQAGPSEPPALIVLRASKQSLRFASLTRAGAVAMLAERGPPFRVWRLACNSTPSLLHAGRVHPTLAAIAPDSQWLALSYVDLGGGTSLQGFADPRQLSRWVVRREAGHKQPVVSELPIPMVFIGYAEVAKELIAISELGGTDIVAYVRAKPSVPRRTRRSR